MFRRLNVSAATSRGRAQLLHLGSGSGLNAHGAPGSGGRLGLPVEEQRLADQRLDHVRVERLGDQEGRLRAARRSAAAPGRR